MSNKTTHAIPCDMEDDKRLYESFKNEIAFKTSIVIAVLSPIAVVGNALILAAVWKKTFVRTPFHILLSGLAITDLCTGLIVQPFYAVTTFMYLLNCRLAYDMPKLLVAMNTISVCSAIYFISITVLLITLMSIERWLHMSRRTLVTSLRGYFTVIILLLIPFPTVASQLYQLTRVVNILIITLLLACYLTTSFACFKVYRIIRGHQQQVRANETSHNNFGQRAIDLAKYKKSVASLLYILLLFSFCFLPFIVYIGLVLNQGISSEIFLVERVSLVLLFLSSALSPGLYIWRMNDIRNRVKQFFCANG